MFFFGITVARVADSDVFLIDQANISTLESVLGECLLLLLMVQKCGLPIDVGSFIKFLGFWDGCFRFLNHQQLSPLLVLLAEGKRSSRFFRCNLSSSKR